MSLVLIIFEEIFDALQTPVVILSVEIVLTLIFEKLKLLEFIFIVFIMDELILRLLKHLLSVT